MARVSKYQGLVGQMVNGVLVKDYQRQLRTSKTGRKYSAYRLWVTQDNENILEISTQSWKKWSFIRRLDNITDWQRAREFHRQLEEKEANDEIIEKMMEAAYFYKESFENLVKEHYFKTDFRNITLGGSIVYETPEEYIKSVDRAITKGANECEDELLKIIYLNEWRTEFKSKLEAYIHNNWDRIWKNTQRQWHNFHGFNEKAYQEPKSTVDWSEHNQYDELFRATIDLREIKKIYRQWSKKLHPDMGGDEVEFKKLHKAYERAMDIAKIAS